MSKALLHFPYVCGSNPQLTKMRNLLCLVFIALSALGYSQEYNFKPIWEKGESKTIKVTIVQKEYEDNELVSDTTMLNFASVKVLKESDENYTLEVLYENQALRSVMAFYDKVGEELTDYKDLKLIYLVNKKDGEIDLTNWEDAQKFMNESFEAITKLLKKKAPEFASFTKLIFLPIEEAFKSKENIEAYMDPYIGFLFTPYGQNFSLGDTISITETEKNPFNAMQDVSATTLLVLHTVNEDANTCQIHQEVILDLSSFIEMMKGMMQKMAESFGVSDSSAAAKTKEMDSFEMNIFNTQEISFDYESTWVTKVVNTATVTLVDPTKGKKSNSETITTVTVK